MSKFMTEWGVHASWRNKIKYGHLEKAKLYSLCHTWIIRTTWRFNGIFDKTTYDLSTWLKTGAKTHESTRMQCRFLSFYLCPHSTRKIMINKSTAIYVRRLSWTEMIDYFKQLVMNTYLSITYSVTSKRFTSQVTIHCIPASWNI